jgi:uncharacterized protein involved in exopolysaccharide biosynthesis
MSTAAQNEFAHQAEDGNGAPEELGAPAPADGGVRLAEGGNIDKIRDILFGVQMRDYEKRFSRLEERVSKESADLRGEIKRRFDSLEAYVKHEFEASSERLRAEQQARGESVEGLSRELRETGRSLERKLAQFDEQAGRAQRELRQQLLEQSQSLSDEIRRKGDELSAALEREVGLLGHDKTDRAALAALFTEVALRLNNEFQVPGGD